MGSKNKFYSEVNRGYLNLFFWLFPNCGFSFFNCRDSKQKIWKLKTFLMFCVCVKERKRKIVCVCVCVWERERGKFVCVFWLLPALCVTHVSCLGKKVMKKFYFWPDRNMSTCFWGIGVEVNVNSMAFTRRQNKNRPQLEDSSGLVH